ILIVKDPPHLQIADGNGTAQRLFTRANRDEVTRQMLAAFRNKQYDQGLVQAMQTIEQRMDENVPAAHSNGSAAAPGAYPQQQPRSNSPFPSQPRGWSFGGLACILIAAVVVIIFIRGIFGRSGGGGYYGGYPQGGGYQQGGYPQGGYPPQGGYGYGGGGGGFGRGFLGGLLGGALGGYAAEKWTEHGQQGGGYVP